MDSFASLFAIVNSAPEAEPTPEAPIDAVASCGGEGCIVA
jgi:hypothetical protein